MATSAPRRLLKQQACRNLRRNSRLVRSSREVVRTSSRAIPPRAEIAIVCSKFRCRVATALGACSPQVLAKACKRSRAWGGLCSINGTGLFQQLLTQLAAGLSTQIFARFVGDIAQLVKDTALFDHPSTVHLSHGGPQFTFAIPNDGLQPGFWAHAPFPEAVKQALPVGLGFPLGEFPIENFAPATAIRPQSQSHQQHHARNSRLGT